jgi:hypothetical protein
LDGYGYSIALFAHLVSLLAAGAGAVLAGYAALRLRAAASPAEVGRWGMMIGNVVRVFPAATLGLLSSGAYMTQTAWSWSTPWIVTGLVGLAMIVLLGSGVEASRGRALGREVRAHGLTERARRLLRDPLAWTAKATTWTLMLAVMFVMSTKPPVWGCTVSIVVALVGGAIIAVPMWRTPPTDFRASERTDLRASERTDLSASERTDLRASERTDLRASERGSRALGAGLAGNQAGPATARGTHAR